MWDAIEQVRPDCGFLYLTHDVEFAATRQNASRYFLRNYFQAPPPNGNSPTWEIFELPEDTGLPESAVVELVGSRKPILFIEGKNGSIDLTLYRHQYDNFTVIPIGSCEAVIHSVASYQNSATLHWLKARGLVDADDRTAAQVAYLKAHDVYSLSVAEIENILLLPNVFLALAEALLCAICLPS